MVPSSAQEDGPPRYDNQANRLDGAAESGDRLSSALGLRRVRDDPDDDTGDRAFIAVPREDRAGAPDAGLVVASASGTGAGARALQVAGQTPRSVGFSGDAVAGQRYGSVLASPAG